MCNIDLLNGFKYLSKSCLPMQHCSVFFYYYYFFYWICTKAPTLKPVPYSPRCSRFRHGLDRPRL